jgi:hypothetical protein
VRPSIFASDVQPKSQNGRTETTVTVPCFGISPRPFRSAYFADHFVLLRREYTNFSDYASLVNNLALQKKHFF